MVSLLVESFGNKIKTKGILKDNSNMKQIIQILVDRNVEELNKLYSLKSNLNFSEYGTDLLTKLKYNKGSFYSLNKRGYQETTSDKYNYENLNNILDYKYIEVIKKEKEPFITTIELNGKDQIKQYEFFCQDDYILFVPTISNSAVEYYYKLNDYKVIDFKIDEYYFVYIILEKDNVQYLAISHLCKAFSKYNDDESTLDIKECYNFIELKLPEKVLKLEYLENNKYYFVDINNQVIEVSLCKKYYFVDGEYIYFNNQGDFDEFSEQFISVEQNNFLNMYNYINFLGLNDFKVSSRKISTKENNLFLEIFKNKFDNTLNGGLNYFNAKKIEDVEISEEIRGMYNSEKDYHININDEYYSIKGNFIYKNYKKGDYKIEVTETEVRLYQVKSDRFLLLEKVKIPSYNEFYFCNLKFTFKKFEFPLEPYILFVSSNSPYLFKQSTVESYKMFSVPNDSKSISTFIENSLPSDKVDMNTNFDGKKIIFSNYFDWKKKRYKYGHLSKKVKNQEVIDIKNFKKYTFLSDNVVKEDKLYARSPGELYYTNTANFSFELINSKGYITPFWINNQDKIIYFKNINNAVVIIDNKYESDFYTYIPSIKNYIRFNSNMYNNVSVSINDDLDVEIRNSNNILITDKISNNPLFYKVYIEDSDLMNIHIFNNDDEEVTEYIQESFDNGYVFYFNIEKGKKYYFNTLTSKYNYFDPIEAYKNIESLYYFNETGYITLKNQKHLSSFTLKSNVVIEKSVSFSLFFYNTVTGTTNKISLSKDELNNKFEIDFAANKIYLEIDNDEYKKDDFYIVDDSNNSLISEDYITFFKNDRKDIVYIAEKNIDVDIDKLDLSKLKVNTIYKINDYDNIIATKEGSFVIDGLTENEIAIIPNVKNENYINTKVFITESLGDNTDTFYKRNFKNPGGHYINHDVNSIKIAETNNINISTDELFITKTDGGDNE